MILPPVWVTAPLIAAAISCVLAALIAVRDRAK